LVSSFKVRLVMAVLVNWGVCLVVPIHGSTEYRTMGYPPLSAGAVQVTLISPDVPVAVAEVMVGAPGFPVVVIVVLEGLAELENSEAVPQPIELWA
jgi:hypothetical protein